MAATRQATILHADLDAFYASVEQLLDPSLRGRPIAVGRRRGARRLLRGQGVRRGRRHAGVAGAGSCAPGWRFVDGHFREYQRLADRVIDVFRDFTPLVERISIDEAFLDVTGSVHLFGSPAIIAAAIRHRVRAEIGLPISVGVARTKHLAKIASQVAKPDGLVVVAPERETAFLHPLPVELMWGVGPVTRARLAATGIRTIGQLAATATPILEHLLGRAAGDKLGALAVNTDPRRIDHGRPGAARSGPRPRSAAGRPPPTCSGPRSASSPTGWPAGCGRPGRPGARSPSGCGSPACGR